MYIYQSIFLEKKLKFLLFRMRFMRHNTHQQLVEIINGVPALTTDIFNPQAMVEKRKGWNLRLQQKVHCSLWPPTIILLSSQPMLFSYNTPPFQNFTTMHPQAIKWQILGRSRMKRRTRWDYVVTDTLPFLLTDHEIQYYYYYILLLMPTRWSLSHINNSHPQCIYVHVLSNNMYDHLPMIMTISHSGK